MPLSTRNWREDARRSAIETRSPGPDDLLDAISALMAGEAATTDLSLSRLSRCRAPGRQFRWHWRRQWEFRRCGRWRRRQPDDDVIGSSTRRGCADRATPGERTRSMVGGRRIDLRRRRKRWLEPATPLPLWVGDGRTDECGLPSADLQRARAGDVRPDAGAVGGRSGISTSSGPSAAVGRARAGRANWRSPASHHLQVGEVLQSSNRCSSSALAGGGALTGTLSRRLRPGLDLRSPVIARHCWGVGDRG